MMQMRFFLGQNSILRASTIPNFSPSEFLRAVFVSDTKKREIEKLTTELLFTWTGMTC